MTQPERAAVKDLGRDLSYAALCEEAGRLAAGLVASGVGDGDRVVLHLPNSVDFAVAALACLWIGATFVPLSVTDPAARLAVILEDCDPALALTAVDGDEGPAPSAALARFRWTTLPELLTIGGETPEPLDDGDRIAYAIYTSGTTGTPKGVMIGNGAFSAAVQATVGALGLTRETRTLCVSPFHFDGSFGTLFPTLFAGGAVVIRPRESLLYPRTFFNAVAQEAVTYTGFSPTYLRLLLSSPQVNKLASVKLLVALGGEASSAADIRALWSAAPQVQVYNRYGPTETTIAVTHIEVTPDLIEDGTVPIGQPHPGVNFYLVDDHGQLVEEVGRVGELYIGGAQLMAGYWGAPELTGKVLRTDIVPGETRVQDGRSGVPGRHGRLRLRGPGRPGHQAQRGQDLPYRDGGVVEQAARSLGRGLPGLRRRWGARHRGLRRGRFRCHRARAAAGRTRSAPRNHAPEPDPGRREPPSHSVQQAGRAISSGPGRPARAQPGGPNRLATHRRRGGR